MAMSFLFLFACSEVPEPHHFFHLPDFFIFLLILISTCGISCLFLFPTIHFPTPFLLLLLFQTFLFQTFLLLLTIYYSLFIHSILTIACRHFRLSTLERFELVSHRIHSYLFHTNNISQTLLI